MTYPESEFYDCKTLALMYDSDRDVIKRTVHELKDKGHVIEILYWGKQGKMKMHGKGDVEVPPPPPRKVMRRGKEIIREVFAEAGLEIKELKRGDYATLFTIEGKLII